MSRIYTVAHLKGGAGKTTTSILMAAHFADKGKRVVFIDADTKSGQGSRFVARRETTAKEYGIELPLIEVVPTRDRKHMAKTAMNLQEQGYEVIIDCNPLATDLFIGTLVVCDVAIHPLRQGHTELDSFQTFFDVLHGIHEARAANGLNKLKSRTLLTDYRPTKLGRRLVDYMESLDMPFMGVIPHSERFGEAIHKGCALWELTPRHAHVPQIQEVILGCTQR
jgi:cellulose biosynthesis protein BcsQ